MNSKTILVHICLLLMITGQQPGFAEEREADHGEFLFDGDSVELALLSNRMHPRVVVELDGQEYEFIVDTGATVNVIDTKIAENRGYKVIDETEIGAPGGPQLPATVVKVPSLKVGAAMVKNAEFVTMDIAGFSGGQTQGVLGIGLFREHLLTFDEGAGRLTVSHDRLAANDPGVLAYTSDESSLISIDLDVAGSVVPVHVDTGSMGSFMISSDLMESLPVRTIPQQGMRARLVGGERDIQFAQLQGTVEFAGLSYENPNITFMSSVPGAGNIGGEIMRELVVSIDQENQLIRFHKPVGCVDGVSTSKPRRLGVMFRGMPGDGLLTVGGIVPGSLAEKAGLQAGDDLVSLNDRPAAEYEMAELREVFSSSKPLSIDINRDGEVRTIKIP